MWVETNTKKVINISDFDQTPYTEEQDNLIIDYFKNKPYSINHLSTILNRSIGGIKKRATFLGVNNKPTKTNWTSEEDKFLKNNFGFVPIYCISKKLKNKDVIEVANRAKELELNLVEAAHKKYRRQHNWYYEEDKFLRENFNIMSYNVIAEHLNKTQKQVSTYAKDIGLVTPNQIKKNNIFNTHYKVLFTENEIEYLKNNFQIGIEKLQEQLPGRTKQQIYSKIKKLGLLSRKRTFPEMCVESILNDLNCNYISEYRMNNCKRKFIIDFLVNGKYAIEVQGEYWHAHNWKQQLTQAQLKNIERDKIKFEEMIRYGYKVLYIYEEDIKFDKNNDFNKCKQIIKEFINGENV